MIEFLVSIFLFYLGVIAQIVLQGVFYALFNGVTKKQGRREIICSYNPPRLEDPAFSDPAGEEFAPDKFEPERAVRRLSKEYKPTFDVSKLIAMDGRSVVLEMWFRRIFYKRIAIATVVKPRAGEPVPTVTFVLCNPASIFEGTTFEVQVPDEQLGDFEAVRKGLYRLKTVLFLDEVVSEI
jgi:hypothetical protein